uniref:Glucose transporter rco-3 n=1 Tax=Ganoderma boninense TaxID=34458 RepID=A0A5K1K7B4_9APHY|nr:Glucose transporter rco-3 [Ganoderma boninense]
MTVVEPLLSLHLLRHIVLGFDSFILQLSSDDVLSLSESWPAVEELHIDVATPKSGRAGFESLLHFAHRCPRLRVVRLPVMDVTPGTFEELEYPAEPHPLRDLGIKEVVFPLGMDFSREKTGFIRRVFPNVAPAAPATFPIMS